MEEIKPSSAIISFKRVGVWGSGINAPRTIVPAKMDGDFGRKMNHCAKKDRAGVSCTDDFFAGLAFSFENEKCALDKAQFQCQVNLISWQ